MILNLLSVTRKHIFFKIRIRFRITRKSEEIRYYSSVKPTKWSSLLVNWLFCLLLAHLCVMYMYVCNTYNVIRLVCACVCDACVCVHVLRLVCVFVLINNIKSVGGFKRASKRYRMGGGGWQKQGNHTLCNTEETRLQDFQ